MRTLAKRLKKEQRKIKRLVKERDAALHQANVQREMRIKEEIKVQMQGKLITYLVREHCSGEVEIDVKKMMAEEPQGTVGTRPENGKYRIKAI